MKFRKTNCTYFCDVQDLDLNIYDMKLKEIIYDRERKLMGWEQRRSGV